MKIQSTPQTLADAVKAYQAARALDDQGRKNGRTREEHKAHSRAVRIARVHLLNIAGIVKYDA